MDDIISEVGLSPEMKSKKTVQSLDIRKVLEIGNILDEDAIWVSFGVGGPA